MLKYQQWLLLGGHRDFHRKVVTVGATDHYRAIDSDGVRHVYHAETFAVPVFSGVTTYIIGFWECISIDERPSKRKILEWIARSGVKPASGINTFPQAGE